MACCSGRSGVTQHPGDSSHAGLRSSIVHFLQKETRIMSMTYMFYSHISVSPVSHSYLVCQSKGILEKQQVVLPQPDDITRVKLHFFSQHFAVPRDHSVLTRAEHGGAADAMAMEIAVSWKDVSGKEKDVRL